MFFGIFILVFYRKNQVAYLILKIKGQLKKLTCTFLCVCFNFSPQEGEMIKLLNWFGAHRQAELGTLRSRLGLAECQ